MTATPGKRVYDSGRIQRAVHPTIDIGPPTGELEVATSPNVTQLPARGDVQLVKIKAAYDNAARVYVGTGTVVAAQGITNVTTGWELSPGEETPWFPVPALEQLYVTSAGQSERIFYLAIPE